MLCEKCKTDMLHVCENSVQGWSCPTCGWGILTTHIDKIYQDITEYSIHIKKTTDIDKNKIKLISKITGVNYREAKEILDEGDICILKSKAPKVKEVRDKLIEADILFEIEPAFNY